ncbi:unnamed protein product [Allacma fusca]|uniref:Uncharacterized protein n=1 Tax=Allacma fusca TaxID=39272 RepID=A0A8J2P262_9HEXA|nr:unnamed protein product [Allacma fusca]
MRRIFSLLQFPDQSVGYACSTHPKNAQIPLAPIEFSRFGHGTWRGPSIRAKPRKDDRQCEVSTKILESEKYYSTTSSTYFHAKIVGSLFLIIIPLGLPNLMD